MTIRRMGRWALAAVALLLGGCGTTANLFLFSPEEGGKQVFGGVRADWKAAQEFAQPGPAYVNDAGERVTRAMLFTMDMPFSIVGDTLTLPVTISKAMGWLPEPEKKDTSKATSKPSRDAAGNTPSPDGASANR
jgi:uncharacterized protein YceK